MPPDELLKTYADKSTEAYFSWVRQMTTLSTGALTVLVSLRSQIVPASPSMLWTLGATWVCLAISLMCAATILWSEHDVYTQASNLVIQHINQSKEVPTFTVRPRFICWIAQKIFPLTLAISVVFLCWFSLANIAAGK